MTSWISSSVGRGNGGYARTNASPSFSCTQVSIWKFYKCACSWQKTGGWMNEDIITWSDASRCSPKDWLKITQSVPRKSVPTAERLSECSERVPFCPSLSRGAVIPLRQKHNKWQRSQAAELDLKISELRFRNTSGVEQKSNYRSVHVYADLQ